MGISIRELHIFGSRFTLLKAICHQNGIPTAFEEDWTFAQWDVPRPPCPEFDHWVVHCSIVLGFISKLSDDEQGLPPALSATPDTESDVQSFRSTQRHLSKQSGLLWVSEDIFGNCKAIEPIHLQFTKIYDTLSTKQFSSLKWV